jgi:hypothetical protein
MADTTMTFSAWLEQADITPHRLSQEQASLLQAAFRFRQQQGTDYYARRILSHFLLHCHSGLKVAAIARLVGASRPTTSGHQGLSAKLFIQQTHHRQQGRNHGKLLPRFAGPVAAFLVSHPQASRTELADFVHTTFGVRVCRIALYHFLKRYGLDHIPQATHPAVPTPALPLPASPATPEPAPASASLSEAPVVAVPKPVAAPPFSAHAPSMPVPSC